MLPSSLFFYACDVSFSFSPGSSLFFLSNTPHWRKENCYKTCVIAVTDTYRYSWYLKRYFTDSSKCMRCAFISWVSVSYLPQKESQQGQQQQPEQDGQHDDPPRHASILSFTPLWEHRQFQLGTRDRGTTSVLQFRSFVLALMFEWQNNMFRSMNNTSNSAFFSTMFFALLSTFREALTITSTWWSLE